MKLNIFIVFLCTIAFHTSVASPRQIISGTHDLLSEDIVSLCVYTQDQMTKYHADFGHFPHGDNREVIRQLLGFNSKNKPYAYLNENFFFDKSGTLLDPWLKPYEFRFEKHQAKVLSRIYVNSRAQPPRNWMPSMSPYPPIPTLSKKDLNVSQSYKLAVSIRLMLKRKNRFPVSENMAGWLAQTPDNVWPYIDATAWPYTSKEESKKALTDPWGSLYIVKFTSRGIDVSSVHSSHHAIEQIP